MSVPMSQKETQKAAAAALNTIFTQQHKLNFREEQITLDAAVFSFKALMAVDKASRASLGLFKLWSPIAPTSWAGIGVKFVKAVLKATDQPEKYQNSAIGRTTAIPHKRNLQFHLNDPDTFPCPDYR